MTLWLNRTLLVGPNLALVLSEKQLEQALGDLDVEPPEHWCGHPSWHACTHTWRVDGQLVCVVAANPAFIDRMEPTHVAALLVHEAAHVWQETRRTIGNQICDETEAYAVQNICRELFDAYVKLKEKQ